MEEKEIWKPIEDFPMYEISNFGRVRNARNGYMYSQAVDSTTGYSKIPLSKNGNRYTKSIHRLVAETFMGKQPGLDVNHIDGNKLNNKLNNLEWCTRGENIKHSYDIGLRQPPRSNMRPVKIVETGETFESIRECAKAINGKDDMIMKCLSDKYNRHSHKGLHFEYITKGEYEQHINRMNATSNNDFLYPHQRKALKEMFNGCLLNGGTGSGKSRTGIYYFFSKNGGSIENGVYTPMRPNPPDLYILTTAKKRDDLEWEEELIPYHLYPDKETKIAEYYGNKVIIDSWQNIKKYANVTDAQFIFDENKINGKGVWAKSFIQIAKNNEWIILSATNGDKWEDYETVFLAHGFFRTRTEFRQEHLVYSNYLNFPKVTGYRSEERLIRLRDKLLIDMDFDRQTTQIHENVFCSYDIQLYKDTMRKRWDPFKNEPITQPSGLCYILRRIVNSDESRQVKLLEMLEDCPKAIIFYNFDFELEILLGLAYPEGTVVAQYNGHRHDKLPKSDRWVYLTQYTSGCEAWNTTDTDTIIFYSNNYSYKVMTQASGRIDRLTTKFKDLHYYHLTTRSSIDLAISRALTQKKKFNERRFAGWDK